MAIDWERLAKHGIQRAGNSGKGLPEAFTIVDVDIPYDDLVARIPAGDDHDRTLAIIRYACRDADRLKEDLPNEWIDAFDITGKTDPVHFWQFIDAKGKSYALMTNGRSRCLAIRVINDRRKADGRPLIKLDGMPDPFLSKNAAQSGLRLKRLRNRAIPDPLSTLAESAGEWVEQGHDAEGVAREMGINVEKATVLIRWAGVFPKLCEEARKRANDGKLALGAAIRLANKHPGEAEQKAYLEGKREKRAKGESKPLSPRTLGLLAGEMEQDQKVPDGFIALMRLVNGDASAAKNLPAPVLAAWKRAEEQAKQRVKRAGA